MLQTLLKRAENILDRVLGVFGGLVCAVVMSLTAYYFWEVFRFHFLWLVAAAAGSVILFGMLGLLLHRYFVCFTIPVFNFFANSDVHGPGDDGYSLRQMFVLISFLFAWVALIVGALFQIHIAVAVGAVLFFGYALYAPRAFKVQG